MPAFMLDYEREITYEVAGDLDGDIHDLTVTICGPKGLRIPLRKGTPDDMAARLAALANLLTPDDLYDDIMSMRAYREAAE